MKEKAIYNVAEKTSKGWVVDIVTFNVEGDMRKEGKDVRNLHETKEHMSG